MLTASEGALRTEGGSRLLLQLLGTRCRQVMSDEWTDLVHSWFGLDWIGLGWVKFPGFLVGWVELYC